MALEKFTKTQVLDQLVTGNKWSNSIISYAFATTVSGIGAYSGEGAGFSALTSEQQQFAKLALSLWDETIANSIQVSKTALSDIEFGNSSSSSMDFAHAYYPIYGSVWFNDGYNILASPEIGDYGFMTYLHEIGHALGLDHMGDYNGSATAPSSYQDSTVYTIMSYYGPDHFDGMGQVAWADWFGPDGFIHSPQTPMLYDIMAIQKIYGVDKTTRTGNTVYGFDSNVTGAKSSIFDFSKNDYPILCIFDSAGNDTINLSGYKTSSTIKLTAGSFSSFNEMTNNLSIAYSCVIENAVSGSGDDKLYGNSVANVLKGGAGKDMISAGAGNDKLYGGSGADTLTGGAGSDLFIFESSTKNGVDVIKDFIKGDDLIDVSRVDTGEFRYISTSNFHNKALELRLDLHDGYSILNGDINGDGKSDFQIKVIGSTNFSVGDFIL